MSVSRRSVIHQVFNLIKDIFDWLVGVVRSAEDGVIVLDISRQDIVVCSVEMIEDGTGGGGSVSHVFIMEGTDKNLINGEEENLAERFFVAIIFIEEHSSNIFRVAEFGNLGACGVIWDNMLISGPDGHDKSGG